MNKKMRIAGAVLLAVVIGLMLRNSGTSTNTVLCMTLIGPKIITNAEYSIAPGRMIKIKAPNNPVTALLPVESCMILMEKQ